MFVWAFPKLLIALCHIDFISSFIHSFSKVSYHSERSTCLAFLFLIFFFFIITYVVVAGLCSTWDLSLHLVSSPAVTCWLSCSMACGDISSMTRDQT